MTSVDDLRLELRAVSSALSPGLGVNNGFTSHSVHNLHRGHYRGLLNPAQDDFTGRIHLACAICTCVTSKALFGIILGERFTKENEGKLIKLLNIREDKGFEPIQLFKAKLSKAEYKIKFYKI